jgi:hypothetical protein
VYSGFEWDFLVIEDLLEKLTKFSFIISLYFISSLWDSFLKRSSGSRNYWYSSYAVVADYLTYASESRVAGRTLFLNCSNKSLGSKTLKYFFRRPISP